MPFVIVDPSFCSTKLVNIDEIVVVDKADVEELKYLLTATAAKHLDHGLQDPLCDRMSSPLKTIQTYLMPTSTQLSPVKIKPGWHSPLQGLFKGINSHWPLVV